MTTDEILDLAKARHQVSDYKLAQLLGVADSAVGNYRKGRSRPDDRVVLRLAELTDLDPGEIAAWMQVERAQSEETRALWRNVAERLARSTVAGLVAVVGVSITPDAGAAILHHAVSSAPAQSPAAIIGLYVMSTYRRARSRVLGAVKRIFSAIPASGVSPALGLAVA